MDLQSYFSNKTVILTGHTGFKGAWLTLMLHKWGAKIIGIALAAAEDSLYQSFNGDQFCEYSYVQDINDAKAIREIFERHQPDVVFHLAAQALVRPSYLEPIKTFETNVMGTIHILDAIRHLSKKCVSVMITTDKVYENLEQNIAFVETDKLGGYDPYSASKAACEIAIASYIHSYFNIANYDSHQKSFVCMRAGNVIGGGDMAQDRILPDIVRAIASDMPVQLRNPNAVRPWQHVLEPLYVYALIAAKLSMHPQMYNGAYNIGPEATDILSVEKVAQLFIKSYGKGSITYDKGPHVHEANFLALDNTKLKKILNWKPILSATEAVNWAAEWYAAPYSALDKTNLQLEAYLNKVIRQ